MAYCTPEDVRNLSDITTSDINSQAMAALIKSATTDLNHKVQVKVIEENVSYIDEYRQNKIDDSNTTFFVSKSWDWYLGDLNNDGVVDTNDITVYEYDSSADTKTELAVSSIDEVGSFVVSSAPSSNNTLTVTYAYAPLSMQTPDYLITKACRELTTALCYSKINPTNITKVGLGRLRVDKDASGYDTFYSRYLKTLDDINSRSLLRKQVSPVSMNRTPITVHIPPETTNTGGVLG